MLRNNQGNSSDARISVTTDINNHESLNGTESRILIRLRNTQQAVNGSEAGQILDPSANLLILSLEERKVQMIKGRISHFTNQNNSQIVDSVQSNLPQVEFSVVDRNSDQTLFNNLNRERTGLGSLFFDPNYRVPENSESGSVLIRVPNTTIGIENRGAFISNLQNSVSLVDVEPTLDTALNDVRKRLSRQLKDESNAFVDSNNTDLENLRNSGVQAPRLTDIVLNNDLRTPSLEIPIRSIFGIFSNGFILHLLDLLNSSSLHVPASVLMLIIMSYRSILLTFFDVRFWFYSVQNLLNSFRSGLESVRIVSLANIARLSNNVRTLLGLNLDNANLVNLDIVSQQSIEVARLRILFQNSIFTRVSNFFTTRWGRLTAAGILVGVGGILIRPEFRDAFWRIIVSHPRSPIIRVDNLVRVASEITRQIDGFSIHNLTFRDYFNELSIKHAIKPYAPSNNL